MKVKIIVLFFILFTALIYSQPKVSIGGFIGGGQFSGNTASVGGFTTSLFTEVDLPLFEAVYPRLSLIFTKDLNAIIPNATQDYNPYLFGLSFKGVTTQYFENNILLEEGVGLTALNDRTLIGTDVWDYGVVISLSIGYDLRNFNLNGFQLGAGAEYGITFFNTLPKYSSIHLFFIYTI